MIPRLIVTATLCHLLLAESDAVSAAAQRKRNGLRNFRQTAKRDLQALPVFSRGDSESREELPLPSDLGPIIAPPSAEESSDVDIAADVPAQPQQGQGGFSFDVGLLPNGGSDQATGGQTPGGNQDQDGSGGDDSSEPTGDDPDEDTQTQGQDPGAPEPDNQDPDGLDPPGQDPVGGQDNAGQDPVGGGAQEPNGQEPVDAGQDPADQDPNIQDPVGGQDPVGPDSSAQGPTGGQDSNAQDPAGQDPSVQDPTGGQDPNGQDPAGAGQDPDVQDPVGGQDPVDQVPNVQDPTGGQDPVGQDPNGQDPVGAGQDPDVQDPVGGQDPVGQDPTFQDPAGGQDPVGQDPNVQDPATGGQDPSGQDPVGVGQDPTGQDPDVQDPAGGQDPVDQDPNVQNLTGGQDPSGQDSVGGQDPAGQDPAGQDPAGQDPNVQDTPTGGGQDPTGQDPATSDLCPVLLSRTSGDQNIQYHETPIVVHSIDGDEVLFSLRQTLTPPGGLINWLVTSFVSTSSGVFECASFEGPNEEYTAECEDGETTVFVYVQDASFGDSSTAIHPSCNSLAGGIPNVGLVGFVFTIPCSDCNTGQQLQGQDPDAQDPGLQGQQAPGVSTPVIPCPPQLSRTVGDPNIQYDEMPIEVQSVSENVVQFSLRDSVKPGGDPVNWLAASFVDPATQDFGCSSYTGSSETFSATCDDGEANVFIYAQDSSFRGSDAFVHPVCSDALVGVPDTGRVAFVIMIPCNDVCATAPQLPAQDPNAQSAPAQDPNVPNPPVQEPLPCPPELARAFGNPDIEFDEMPIEIQSVSDSEVVFSLRDSIKPGGVPVDWLGASFIDPLTQDFECFAHTGTTSDSYSAECDSGEAVIYVYAQDFSFGDSEAYFFSCDDLTAGLPSAGRVAFVILVPCGGVCSTNSNVLAPDQPAQDPLPQGDPNAPLTGNSGVATSDANRTPSLGNIAGDQGIDQTVNQAAPSCTNEALLQASAGSIDLDFMPIQIESQVSTHVTFSVKQGWFPGESARYMATRYYDFDDPGYVCLQSHYVRDETGSMTLACTDERTLVLLLVADSAFPLSSVPIRGPCTAPGGDLGVVSYTFSIPCSDPCISQYAPDPADGGQRKGLRR